MVCQLLIGSNENTSYADCQSGRLEPFLGGISVEILDFSRDGKYVAYVSFPEGILWLANRDGPGPVQLTRPPFYPRNSRRSPDGTKILFTDNTQNGIDKIWIVSSEGGEPQRMRPEEDEPQNLADWSPDGKSVVYTTFPRASFVPLDYGKVETRILQLATGKITPLPKRLGGFWSTLWSPDGRYIAGQSFDAQELALWDAEKQEWRRLGRKGLLGYQNWLHDGRSLFLVRWDPERVGIYRIPVSGGDEELIFEIPKTFGHTGWYSCWIGFDPTDAPLLFRNTGSDEIYALTLYRE